MISHHTSTSKEQAVKDTSIEGYLNVLKGALLEATNKSCEWTKGPAINIKKYGGRMMLVMVLLRSISYGRSGNKQT